MQNGIAPTALVKDIHPNRHNPRTYFDPQEMAELEASIREVGLLQAIVVRPVFDLPDHKFEIIAGERRYRAYCAVFGRDSEIPVVVRNASDDEAEVLAVVENIQRADMSPVEEAESAERLLAKYGSRDDVARRLGWTRSTLDRRLALLNCVPEVRQALTERKIQLGHAELLASAPSEKQAGALSAVIEQAIPVFRLREQLGLISQSLSAALFDKQGCNNCQYNTSVQASLFSEAMDEGFCTHAACYAEKANAHLQVIADRLIETYPMVRVVTQGDDVQTIKLFAEGKGGVGSAQAKACRGCDKFGCTVSGLVGSMGQVEHDVCFDATCHVTKVAAWIKEQSSKPATVANEDGGKVVPLSHGKVPKATPTVQINKGVLEHRVKVWRDITANVMMAQPELSKRTVVAMVLASQGRNLNGGKLRNAYDAIVGGQLGSGGLPALLDQMTNDPVQIDRLLVGVGATAAFEVSEQDLLALMQKFDVQIGEHWRLDKAFLDLLTKTQIEEVADELGIRAVIGKDWGKIVSGKKSDLIEKMLTVEGFDYYGKVPAMMDWRKKSAETSKLASPAEQLVA